MLQLIDYNENDDYDDGGNGVASLQTDWQLSKANSSSSNSGCSHLEYNAFSFQKICAYHTVYVCVSVSIIWSTLLSATSHL